MKATSGVFVMDVNHQDPLFNVASPVDSWQTNRTTGTPALVPVGSSACVGCPASSFQLIIQLQNLEEGNAAILDANNLVAATITGTGTALPTTSKRDDGGASPTGTYTLGFLSDAAGINSYNVSTSIYSGSATLFTGTSTPNCPVNTSCRFIFRVNYNSGSTVNPSGSGLDMGRAISHLLNKLSAHA